jgi:ferredoxin
MLVDLFEALQAHWKDHRTRVLHVCDGVVGLDGEGPGPAGRLRNIGIVAASYDAVALDAVLARVVGFRQDQVPTTVIAAERGLGVADLDRIEVVGDRIDDVCLPPGDFEPNRGSLRSGMLRWPMTTKFVRDRMVQKPVIVAEKCEGCGECHKVCAAKAITLIREKGIDPEASSGSEPKKKARIDHGVCIRCYCCIEVCKYEAARLGPRPLLARAIDHRRTLAWIGLGLVLTGAGVAASYLIL